MAGTTKRSKTARASRESLPKQQNRLTIQRVSPARMREALAILGVEGEAVMRPSGRFVLLEMARERGEDRIRRVFKPSSESPAKPPGGAARRAEIIAHATEALDGQANAMQWLQQPNRSLAGRTPLEVLTEDAPEAAERVDELLYGIEYGMFA